MVEYAVVGWKEKLGVWEIEVCITEKRVGIKYWTSKTSCTADRHEPPSYH